MVVFSAGDNFKMKSFQERFMHDLVEHSIGGRVIFHPDVYQKGGATREPCDLVWCSNDCIVLMWMINSKKSRQYMVTHNFNQMKGWAKTWKNGRLLTGKSQNKKHQIKYDDYKNKIFISVVGGENSCAEIDIKAKDHLSNQGINCNYIATINEEVLAQIGKFGGSLVDLINFLVVVEKDGRTLSSQEAIEKIEHYKNSEYLKSIEGMDEDFLMGTEDSADIENYRQAMKSQQVARLSEVFNDLSLWQSLRIFHSINYCVRKARSVQPGETGPRHFSGYLDYHPYLLIYQILSADKDFETQSRKMLSVQLKNGEDHPEHWSITVSFLNTYLGILPSLFIGPKPLNFVSATEKILRVTGAP
jgi:hypothetical protein